MKIRGKSLVLWFAAMVFLPVTLAAAATCAVCGAEITGRYVTSQGRAFCSRRCYETTLPRCAHCRRRISGKHTIAEGKRFCSQRCLESILPRCERCGKATQATTAIKGHVYCRTCGHGTRCDSCSLPFREGVRLADGRALCAGCKRDGVFGRQAALPLYRRARAELRDLTGRHAEAIPTLRLVNQRELRTVAKLSYVEGGSMRGYYDRETTTRTSRNGLGQVVGQEREVSRAVLILSGLLPDEFLATAVHELTHDWLADYCPQVKQGPTWLEEGLCQFAAAEVCRKHGLKDALASIANSNDAVYGDGYRYVAVAAKAQGRPGGWRGAMEWLAGVDPKRLPLRAATR